MNNRARLWMARAGQEYRDSVRTWMVTVTMSPSEHAMLDLKASLMVTETVTMEEARCRAFGGEVRRWFRRLHGDKPRDNTSYLAVAELHDSERTSESMRGRPHFHVLLHEKKLGALIPDTDCEFAEESGASGPRTVYRVKDDGRVRQLWTRGFSKVVLCYSEQSAVYVCKYLHKSGEVSTGRVKASPGYGNFLTRIADSNSPFAGCSPAPEASPRALLDPGQGQDPGGQGPRDPVETTWSEEYPERSFRPTSFRAPPRSDWGERGRK